MRKSRLSQRKQQRLIETLSQAQPLAQRRPWLTLTKTLQPTIFTGCANLFINPWKKKPYSLARSKLMSHTSVADIKANLPWSPFRRTP